MKIKFKAVGRKACLAGNKYVEKLKSFFSYSVPGARFWRSTGQASGLQNIHDAQRYSCCRSVAWHEGCSSERGLEKRYLVGKIDQSSRKKKRGIVSPDKQYADQNECVLGDGVSQSSGAAALCSQRPVVGRQRWQLCLPAGWTVQFCLW